MSLTAISVRILRISRPTNSFQCLCLNSAYSLRCSLLAKPRSYKPEIPHLIPARRRVNTIPASEIPFNVSHEELCEKLKSGGINLIDVREPGEIRSSGSIEGSIAIPLGTLATALRFCEKRFKEVYWVEKPRIEDEMILMCHAGVRSKFAAEIARTANYENVREYTDGWHGWKKKTTLK